MTITRNEGRDNTHYLSEFHIKKLDEMLQNMGKFLSKYLLSLMQEKGIKLI